MTDERLRVVVAGAGRVATAVAALLADSGFEVAGVASRSRDSAARAAARLRAPAVDFDALPPADVVLIGAVDAAIPAMAARLAPTLAPGGVLVHFAGSLGIAALGEHGHLRRAALHPVQACPDVETAIARLPGSAWGVTCDADIAPWAREMVVRRLGGLPVEVAEGDRPLWHAAAVTTGNAIAALLASGESLLARLGVADPVGVLGPLAAGAVANARERGGGGATITGPVVRGERATVARHLDHLRERAPDLLPSYVAAARVVLEGARRAGRIDDEVERTMVEVLEGG